MCKSQSLIYLDHAATSFPKPTAVINAVAGFLANSAINPGRSGYDLAISAGQSIDKTRKDLGNFFNNPAKNLNHTIFTSNATDALNLAISGFCTPGDHIVSTTLEHNSVLRPLHMLKNAGVIDFDLVNCDEHGFISPAAIEAAFTGKTRLVIMTHASNVLGTIQPLKEVGALCRSRNIKFLVDAAQTAGAIKVDMDQFCIDMLAFTGHKSLQGSPGIGGLVLGNNVELRSTRWGGTGVQSALLLQPEDLPFKLESGTLNGAGIASLQAGLGWIQNQGMATIVKHERNLALQFVQECSKLHRVRFHGQGTKRILASENFTGETHMPVISLAVDGLEPSAVGMFLDVDWNIAVRTGLHCAPLVHKSMGTYPEGSVRISFGPGNTEDDVQHLLRALAELP